MKRILSALLLTATLLALGGCCWCGPYGPGGPHGGGGPGPGMFRAQP